MKQEVLSGGHKHVGGMGVGWVLIMGNYRVEGGKGLTCVLFKRIGKLLGWGSTFTQRVED